MPTIQSKYLGELRTKAQHIRSGNTLITDAPTDNNGKGEAFSPTDLVAGALGSCMMTMMGIYASTANIDMSGMEMNITKHMASNPRKISRIEVQFNWAEPKGRPEQQEKLKEIARTCPVALSLNENVEQDIQFGF